jgi:hypothetical protein
VGNIANNQSTMYSITIDDAHYLTPADLNRLSHFWRAAVRIGGSK